MSGEGAIIAEAINLCGIVLEMIKDGRLAEAQQQVEVLRRLCEGFKALSDHYKKAANDAMKRVADLQQEINAMKGVQ